jgi:hypothetical protein
MFKVREIFLSSLSALLLAVPAFADQPGWVLTQRSSNFGDQYVYVSPEGLKLVSPKQQCNIVTAAPDWNVCFYNDRTKMFYSTSFSQWMAELDRKMAGRGQDMSERKWNKGAVADVAGIRATEYVMNGGYLKATAKKSTIRHANCWISEQITIPPQISQMLAKVYGLPDTRTFPLKVSYVNTNGSLNTMLDTYRTQSCPIPVAYFGVPTSYRRANSEAEVMMDDDTKQIFNDMMADSPGVGGNNSRSTTTYPTNNNSYAGNNPPTAASPQQPQQPVMRGPASTEVVNVGGINLDKEKLRKVIEALKNANKTPQQ